MTGTSEQTNNSRTKTKGIDSLRDYLCSMEPGPQKETDKLEQILSACWSELDGGNECAMAGYKLRGRMESVRWEPPNLVFILERHGGTALGSTRAELQRWIVDTSKAEAVVEEGGRRQLYPMQPRLNMKPLVEEIANLILQKEEDSRLKWASDGSVRVLASKVLPATVFKQTAESRRMRFQKALESILVAEGWVKLTGSTYRPPVNIVSLT